jgi:multidrug efflux pump
VSIQTTYRGAAASVVESRITEVIEEQIAGIEGIAFIQSSSRDGASTVTIEFDVARDIDSAANDVRDRISTILDELPLEADPPQIRKVDADESPIMWLNFTSDRLGVEELTDYAERFLVDRFSTINGVARVLVGGGKSYAMRVWLDRQELAARGLTVQDVAGALRSENVELPAGSIESTEQELTVRVRRSFRTPEDFARLVLARGADGYLVRLGDVARVVRGTTEDRVLFHGNGITQIGLGIIKSSTSNTLDVARAAKDLSERLNETFPEGMSIEQSFDSSVFVEEAVAEVFRTLAIATGLVVLVILIFLRSVRAMIIPAVTVPVSLIASCIALYALGFSINLLTLLALVLAIGLVVDDAIVVLENIVRRMEVYGETPLVAAYRGARQVGFAVIATTLVLIAVFVPISMLEGDLGRLFSEFALTMASAVAFSSFVALTLSPMLASKLLKAKGGRAGQGGTAAEAGAGAGPAAGATADDAPGSASFDALPAETEHADAPRGLLTRLYDVPLRWSLRHGLLVGLFLALVSAGGVALFRLIPQEYAPTEDRGSFFIFVQGPEGASFDYMREYMLEIERRLMPLVEAGEVSRLLIRAPGGFGGVASFNSGICVVVLTPWSERRSGFAILADVRRELATLPGVRAFPVMRQGFSSGANKPVQFVLGGGSYEELVEWRDILDEKIREAGLGLVGMDWDYKETKPQLEIAVDYDRAAELGVTVTEIGSTLETMLGSRRVGTYIDNGEERDVILEGERDDQRTPNDVQNIYVRSQRSGELIPLANLVRFEQLADSATLNRYNRLRAVTLEAQLEPGYTLGEALDDLERLVREHLPPTVQVDYKGQSRDLEQASGSLFFVFALGLVVVYLVLAAQFESFVHPFVIMLAVPLTLTGGLIGLWVTGSSLNVYSQIGLVMLVGLAAKNGILIVEFANQLRDQGMSFTAALREAAEARVRPIAMTAITTAAGAVPLILSTGAGAETRAVIGLVVLSGVLIGTLFTLFVVPSAYNVLGRFTDSPQAVARRLERESAEPVAQL